MKYCLNLYCNKYSCMPIILGGSILKQWRVLCDRVRNGNKSEYISPCLAPLVHNADQSPFCRF